LTSAESLRIALLSSFDRILVVELPTSPQTTLIVETPTVPIPLPGVNSNIKNQVGSPTVPMTGTTCLRDQQPSPVALCPLPHHSTSHPFNTLEPSSSTSSRELCTPPNRTVRSPTRSRAPPVRHRAQPTLHIICHRLSLDLRAVSSTITLSRPLTSITLRSRSRTTIICILPPSPNLSNILTPQMNQFQLVAIHGTLIHPSVLTSSSESCPGPEQGLPEPLPPPLPLHLSSNPTLKPLFITSSHCFPDSCKFHVVSSPRLLSLSLSYLCFLISSRIPSPSPNQAYLPEVSL
jgi:hypothetical protein